MKAIQCSNKFNESGERILQLKEEIFKILIVEEIRGQINGGQGWLLMIGFGFIWDIVFRYFCKEIFGYFLGKFEGVDLFD